MQPTVQMKLHLLPLDSLILFFFFFLWRGVQWRLQNLNGEGLRDRSWFEEGTYDFNVSDYIYSDWKLYIYILHNIQSSKFANGLHSI